MARKSNNLGAVILVAIILLPLLAKELQDKSGIPQTITFTVFLIAAISLFVLYLVRHNQRFRAIQISNIDSMTGIEFERYLQKLLIMQGYNVRLTPGSGDLGVDLIAARTGELIAIQAKRQRGKVSRRAISDAVAGMQHYHCNRAMVITNSYFTPGAMTLARSTNCTLVDRDALTQWLIEFQKSNEENAS